MRKVATVVACGLVIGVASHQATAQECYTIAGISPAITGRALNPATTFIQIAGNIADGDTVAIDPGGPNERVYEFDANSSVTPGNVAVPVASLDDATAVKALADAVNADALAPCIAMGAPLDAWDQYLTFAWKSDAGYGVNVTSPINTNGSIGGGTFGYNGQTENYLLISGEGLNLTTPVITIKLVKSDDPGTVVTGTAVYRPADGLSLGFKINLMQTASWAGAPLGVYDVVLERAGCDTKTLPAALTIVENLINDQSFTMNLIGVSIQGQWNNQRDDQLSPIWLNNNPYPPDPYNPDKSLREAVRKGYTPLHPMMPDGSVQNPRQYPFPTAGNRTNNGDLCYGSLRWPAVDGHRQMWQTFETDYAQATFATLSGLWCGGPSGPNVLTYGLEIRDGDETGTLLLQTPPRQNTEYVDWAEFSYTLVLPGGPHSITLVVYGENSEVGDAALHVDDLLLRAGADLWPDADDDGDVDQEDFASVQVCYTGAENENPLPEDCQVFDRDSDNDVDATDLEAFEDCATGPTVPLDAAGLPTGCQL